MKSRSTSWSPLAAVVSVTAALLLSTCTPAAAETLSDGHVDLGPRLVDGTWQLQVRNDSVVPEVWLPFDEVTLQVADSAQLQVPDAPEFAFLGIPGDPVWLLPQTQREGVLWPGWNTQHETVRDQLTGPVEWIWEGVRGPGTLVLFLDGSFGGPQVLFDSAAAWPQRTTIDPNVHVHGNWAFTAPGRYEIDMAMAGDLGGQPVRDDRTLVVQVGATTETAPPSQAPATDSESVTAASPSPVTLESSSTSSLPETSAANPATSAVPSTTPLSPTGAEPSSAAAAADTDDPTTATGSAWIWWLVAAVVVVAAAAGVAVLLLRRRSRP